MKRLLNNVQGALLLVFAAMFPIILVFFALALDGANLMTTRARLNDSVKQGLYAIAVENRDNDIKNNQILSHYILSYLPNVKIDTNEIVVDEVAILPTNEKKVWLYTDLNNSLVGGPEGDYEPVIERKYSIHTSVNIDLLIPLNIFGKEGKVSLGSDLHSMVTYTREIPTVNAVPLLLPRESNLIIKDKYDGPISMWEPLNGFLPQKNINFPTTGANNLRFILVTTGIKDVRKLTWPGMNGAPLWYEWTSVNPGPVGDVNLPAQFAIKATDSQGETVVSYRFTLKQWFVHTGAKFAPIGYPGGPKYDNAQDRCESLGNYRLPFVRELTNASGKGFIQENTQCY